MLTKVSLVLLISSLIFALAVVDGRRVEKPKGDELRLIQFNETYTVWMPLAEVEKLARECATHDAHFMDITDTPHLGENPVPNPTTIPSRPTHQAIVNPLIATLTVASLRQSITYLSTQFVTRYYTSSTGVAAVNYLVSQYEQAAGSRTDIEITTFDHSWAQPSIIAKIIGSGPADEIVIIGGHVDSTSSGARAPGADDDASGSCTVLEIFRVLARGGFQPERTIEFHGYAAEEVGLRGSQAIAQQYANQGKVVVAMLQLDMTGYVRAGTTPTIGIMTDFTDTTVTTFLRALVSEYTNTAQGNTRCGYACSDHASWFRAGYPSSFAFESLDQNSNPYIHSVNDEVTRLDLEHALEYARLGVGFAVELSFAE